MSHEDPLDLTPPTKEDWGRRWGVGTRKTPPKPVAAGPKSHKALMTLRGRPHLDDIAGAQLRYHSKGSVHQHVDPLPE